MSGLTASVDLTAGRKSHLLDIDREAVDVTELRVAAASGSADDVDVASVDYAGSGGQVRWGPWIFWFGVHPRRGLELFDVSITSGTAERSVLYRASVSEIVTPYGAPDLAGWAPRDLVDYGLGTYMPVTLVPGADAPRAATFVDVIVPDAFGRPIQIRRAVAIYQRETGAIWRHGAVAKRERQLVVVGAFQVDNYDYIFNWVFAEDASLSVEVQLTGVVNFTESADVAGAEGSGSTRLRFSGDVAEGIQAPIHQHFLCFRLDFDVDTPEHNSVFEMSMRAARDADLKEWFGLREHRLRTELKARRRMRLATGRTWKIVSTLARNALGQATGYEIVPGRNAVPLPDVDSTLGGKLRFAQWHLWVTPYRREEMDAAGRYGRTGLAPGLAEWVTQDRRVVDADVVVWYTLGLNHLPRPEEWPAMPRQSASFRLVPYSFFDESTVGR